jgi:hypothetical protein
MGGAVGGLAGIEIEVARSGNEHRTGASNCFVASQNPSTAVVKMALGRLSAVCLVVVMAILTACCGAQNQDSKAAAKPKWLTCDVDWIFTPYDVASDFSIRLAFRQAPLPDIRVELNPTGESANRDGRRSRTVTAMTDSSGTAHFLSVPAGVYAASAKNALFFPSNEVTVHADGDFDSEITMEWPLEPLPIRVLRGKLTTSAAGNKTNRPLRVATVELVDVYSSKVIESQHTSDDGSYEFSTGEPGLYAVRVTPPYQDKHKERQSGELAIELDPTAKESTIPDLNVVQSECNGVQLFHED